MAGAWRRIAVPRGARDGFCHWPRYSWKKLIVAALPQEIQALARRAPRRLLH